MPTRSSNVVQPLLSRAISTLIFTFVFGSLVPAIDGQLVRQSARQTKEPATAVEKSLAALELANTIAEAGFAELSFEAVERATRDGKVAPQVDLGGLLGSRANANPNRQSLSTEAAMARSLVETSETWKKHGFSPSRRFEVLLKAIFPEGAAGGCEWYYTQSDSRSSNYSVSLTLPIPKSHGSGVQQLVIAAIDADSLDELDEFLDQSSTSIGTLTLTKPVLALAIAQALLVQDKVEQAEAYIRQASTELDGHWDKFFGDSNAKMHVELLGSILINEKVAGDLRSDLLKQSVNHLGSLADNPNDEWWSYVLATEIRKRIVAEDVPGSKELARAYLSKLDRLIPGNEDYVSQRQSGFMRDCASWAFSEGKIDVGLEFLQHPDALRNWAASPALFSAASSLTSELLKLPASKRFELLNANIWTQPYLGLQESSGSIYAPQDSIPPEFLDKFASEQQANHLGRFHFDASPLRSVSLLELTMLDAIELGEEKLIEQQLQKLKDAGSDNYELAQLVWSKARTGSFDLNWAMEEAGDDGQQLRATYSESMTPIPVIYGVVLQALSDDETRALGLDLLSRMKKKGEESEAGWAWVTQYIGRLAEVEAKKPTYDHHRLAHFTQSFESARTNLVRGAPLEIYWVAEKDKPAEWTFAPSAAISSSNLIFKYPLVGDYTIKVKATTSEGSTSSGLLVCGLHIRFVGNSSAVSFVSVGVRGSHGVELENLTPGATNELTIHRSGSDGKMSLSIDGGEPVEVMIPEPEAPLFGYYGYGNQPAAFADLQITGDVKIAREIDLVTPQLLGWSTYFLRNNLESIDVARMISSVQNGLQTTTSQNQLASSLNDADGKPPRQDIAADWLRTEEAIIESVDHKKLRELDRENGHEVNEPSKAARENWMYYIRPLSDGEQVSFEFFYGKGSISVAPTIGRVALIVNEEGALRHWITSDDGDWFGVPSNNRLELSDDRRLGGIKLNHDDWNQGSLRREGDSVILKINGTDVLREPVDEVIGAKFGFFNDPEEFQSRIRQVKMTGPWPDKLPDNLFELTAAEEE